MSARDTLLDQRLTARLIEQEAVRMHTFAKLLTPEQYFELQTNDLGASLMTIDEIRQLAAAAPAKCGLCPEPAWRLSGSGLCFTCTTGEADASEDYELRYTPIPARENSPL